MTNTIVYFISIYYVHSVKYGCPAGLTKVCLRPFGGMHQDFWQAVCLESVRRLGGVKTFWGYRPHCGAKRQRSGSRGCAVHQRGVSPHCMGAQRARSAPKAVAGRSPCAWSADGLQSRFRARSAGHQVSRSAGRQAVWGEVSRSAGQQVSRSAGGQVGKIDTNQADTPREVLIQQHPQDRRTLLYAEQVPQEQGKHGSFSSPSFRLSAEPIQEVPLKSSVLFLGCFLAPYGAGTKRNHP
mgnify:FL=1